MNLMLSRKGNHGLLAKQARVWSVIGDPKVAKLRSRDLRCKVLKISLRRSTILALLDYLVSHRTPLGWILKRRLCDLSSKYLLLVILASHSLVLRLITEHVVTLELVHLHLMMTVEGLLLRLLQILGISTTATSRPTARSLA